MMALVASVVPWMMRPRSPGLTPGLGKISAMPVSTACLGRARRGQHLGGDALPPISRARSVKVPPISTPTRTSPACVLIVTHFPSQRRDVQRTLAEPVTPVTSVSLCGTCAGAIGSSLFGTTPFLQESRMAVLNVNGKPVEVDADPDTPLLWVLRDTLGLTGTKFGCGIAQCGACTVHVDGAADALLPSRRCQRAAARRSPPSKACAGWQAAPGAGGLGRADVPQCGYCQSGRSWRGRAARSRSPSRPTPTSTRP